MNSCELWTKLMVVSRNKNICPLDKTVQSMPLILNTGVTSGASLPPGTHLIFTFTNFKACRLHLTSLPLRADPLSLVSQADGATKERKFCSFRQHCSWPSSSLLLRKNSGDHWFVDTFAYEQNETVNMCYKSQPKPNNDRTQNVYAFHLKIQRTS